MPRLLRTPIGRWVDPADAFAALFGDETDIVWLDSGPDASAGRSYLGSASRTVTSGAVDSVIETLRRDLAANRVADAAGGFALGWVGWLGYETRFETMGTPRTRVSPYPDAAFLFLDRAVEFDHVTREVTLLALGESWDGELAAWRDRVESVLADSHRVAAPSINPETVVVHWRDTDEEYLAKIRECQAAIAAGDAYLLCLTTSGSGGCHARPAGDLPRPSRHESRTARGAAAHRRPFAAQLVARTVHGGHPRRNRRVAADQGNPAARRDAGSGCGAAPTISPAARRSAPRT